MGRYVRETVVYPGHMGVTTLGREWDANPFLSELRAAAMVPVVAQREDEQRVEGVRQAEGAQQAEGVQQLRARSSRKASGGRTKVEWRADQGAARHVRRARRAGGDTNCARGPCSLDSRGSGL